MRIDGISLPDVPVMSAALSDDLVLVVQRSGLLVQSYQNLTSTYYAIAGEIKIPGINLPTVQIATSQPTDELVLIVENSALAVKQVGFNAPVMSDGSKIAVPGIGIPSVRFSGTIDGDEYVLAVRANNLCLIPIPSSFSAGALPTAGQTFYASLKTSLVPEVGTGGPTWSRATAAWRFNDIGVLRQIPSGCAEFGGARLVVNTVRTKSEDFSNAIYDKFGAITTPSANVVVCANATSQQFLACSTTGSTTNTGSVYLFGYRIKRIPGGADFIQMTANSISFGTAQYCNFSLTDGSYAATGCTATSSLVAGTTDTYDFTIRVTATGGSASDSCNLSFANSLASTRLQNFVGDGVKSFGPLRAWSVDVTGYDASYVPEYVSVGVLSAPYHGAGADGCKYFATDWQGAPIPVANLTRLRKDTAGTNVLLWSRDLSNAAWSTKTNIIAAKIANGLDGIANSASTLTATSADAIILQPTSGIASAARCSSAYVRRKTGTGTISFTQDGGSTWTDITSQLNATTYSRVQITATLANPSVGFKISTSGDVIVVDCVQNEAGEVATSPIVTTTTTVNRSADSLTDQTSSNWSDTAGTAYILAKPVVYSGGAVGSATNGLLLSASNSGATAYDGTNSANGPTGTPGAVEKLALAWGSSTMSVASSGLVGTPGTYDGAMGLSSIGVGVGAVGYFGDVAIYNYKMTDAELQAITT